MTIKNSVSNNFLSTFVDSINVFDRHLSDVITVCMFVCVDEEKKMVEKSEKIKTKKIGEKMIQKRNIRKIE